nr:DNA-processing protein DprA [Piscinibacter sakaiensis]
MSSTELAAWLRLIETPQIGRDGARRLLAAFGSPEAVFEADPAALAALGSAALAEVLQAVPPGWPARVAAVEAWRHGAPAGGPARDILALGDPGYPPLLLQMADPPLLVYTLGRREVLAREAVAIVGSRHPTPQGLATARELAGQLGEQGLTIVSGLALGIDGAAHEAALDAGAPTVAVLGSGVDQPYPRRHVGLAARIVDTGLLVSEYPPGTPPLAAHFPQRNRLIAGLARGTLVVEAGLPSGSLITARLAAEAGREVFAVPGSIRSPLSRGCHALLRDGATLVETVDDVLRELRPGPRQPGGASEPRAADPADPGGGRGSAADRAPAAVAGPDAGPAEAAAIPHARALLRALGHDPIGLDELGARTGLGAAVLGGALLELELAGIVARLPGQRFQRLGRG